MLLVQIWRPFGLQALWHHLADRDDPLDAPDRGGISFAALRDWYRQLEQPQLHRDAPPQSKAKAVRPRAFWGYYGFPKVEMWVEGWEALALDPVRGPCLRLKPDATLFRQAPGFAPIPTERIGTAGFRAQLPAC